MFERKGLRRLLLAVLLLFGCIAANRVAMAADGGGEYPQCDCYVFGYHGHVEVFEGIPFCWKVDCWVPLNE